MTTTMDRSLEKQREPVESERKSLRHRQANLHILRYAMLGLPLILFAAAILTHILYWATTQSRLGLISIGLAFAAVLLSIVVAYGLLEP